MARAFRSIEEILGDSPEPRQTLQPESRENKPELTGWDLFSIGAYQGFRGALLQHTDSLSRVYSRIFNKNNAVNSAPTVDYIGEALKSIPRTSSPGNIGFSASCLGYMAGNIAANPVVLGTTFFGIVHYFSR